SVIRWRRRASRGHLDISTTDSSAREVRQQTFRRRNFWPVHLRAVKFDDKSFDVEVRSKTFRPRKFRLGFSGRVLSIPGPSASTYWVRGGHSGLCERQDGVCEIHAPDL